MQYRLLAELGGLRPIRRLSGREEALGVGGRSNASQFPRQFLLASSRGLVVGAIGAVGVCGGNGGRVGGRRGDAALVVVAQGRRPLVGKVGVGVGGGRGVFEGVALASDGVGAVAGDVGDEARLAEAGLFVLGGWGAVAFVRVLAGVAVAVDAEEVLDALRDLAVLGGGDGLVGGQRRAGEGALLRHGGVAGGGGAEELRHGGVVL